MRILPSVEDVKKIAATENYNVVPISCEILSAFLRQILSEYKSPRFDYLPSFTGGLVGYFSYDYYGYSEPSIRTGAENSEAFKDVDLMLFDKVIVFDNFRHCDSKRCGS